MQSERFLDLRQGDYADVLKDVTCDLLLADPPYSARTHDGHDNGSKLSYATESTIDKRLRLDKTTGNMRPVGKNRRQTIDYTSWTPKDVHKFVKFWHPRTRGWMVCFCDHELIPAYEAAYAAVGRYGFSPLSYMVPGGRVRMTGDGPAQWGTHMVAGFVMASRPTGAEFFKWGALSGGYVLPEGQPREKMIGGKEAWIMRTLVRDYSRRGDVVCDPCAGWGTTLVAAMLTGRVAVGAERDPETYQRARARLDTITPLSNAR
jgi:hypothetical protein